MKLFFQILEMLPKIIAAVKMIEEFLPIPGLGKAKLKLITDIAEELGGEAKTMIPTITKVVGKVVEFANAVGIFKKPVPPVA